MKLEIVREGHLRVFFVYTASRSPLNTVFRVDDYIFAPHKRWFLCRRRGGKNGGNVTTLFNGFLIKSSSRRAENVPLERGAFSFLVPPQPAPQPAALFSVCVTPPEPCNFQPLPDFFFAKDNDNYDSARMLSRSTNEIRMGRIRRPKFRHWFAKFRLNAPQHPFDRRFGEMVKPVQKIRGQCVLFSVFRAEWSWASTASKNENSL